MSDELTMPQEEQQETTAPVEEAATAAAADNAGDEESFADLMAKQDIAQVRIQKGQKVQGKVVDMNEDTVFVNIGAKLEGVMEMNDFRDAEGNVNVSVGDDVEAWITQVSSGEIRLARSMSGAGMQAIEDARENGVPVELAFGRSSFAYLGDAVSALVVADANGNGLG